jgi:hypothetical protein
LENEKTKKKGKEYPVSWRSWLWYSGHLWE